MTASSESTSGAGPTDALLAAALRQAPEGIALLERDRLVFANLALTRWLDRLAGSDSGPGRSYDDQFRALLSEAGLASDAGPLEGHLSVGTADGPRSFHLQRVPLEADPFPSAAVFVRAASEPRGDSQLAASERLRSLGHLAASVAHDINNPLAYVLGSLDVAERALGVGASAASADASESLVLDALANAREGAERVRAIVKDLMAFSKPVAAAKELVNLEAVLDATVNLSWNQIRHRSRVVKHYGGVSPVLANESRLSQVFLNLIVNAAQAIEEAATTDARITLSTWQTNDRVWAEVADTGTGIRECDLPHVFEPFFSTKPAGIGTGLGLSICQSIVKSYGGGVSASTIPESGSAFRIWLPLASHTPSGRPLDKLPSVPRVESPARILIVDDEPLLGQTLCFAFSGRHEVVVASSGRDAIARLEKDSRFDLVLCDLMMPDVPGQKVFEVVLREHAHLVPRFVFMTGGAFTERAHEFLERHAGRRLDKPFTIAEIEALLCAVR